MKTSLRAVALAAFASVLCAQAHAGWKNNVDVKDVRAGITAASMVSFGTTQSMSNPAACAGVDYYAVAFDVNGHHRSVLAILLTAMATGRKVNIYVVDGQCHSTGRPLVQDVTIQ
jgi:hypothetical protein